jgi:hypothetical protein
MQQIILTRYLYVKEEVMYSLMNALLNKEREEALFWCYEIYYSGFKEEIIIYLIQLYYDFYVSCNKDLHGFLLSLVSDWTKNNKKHWIPGAIIENLVNHDIYTDSITLQKLENKNDYANDSIKQHELYPLILSIMACNTDEDIICWFNEPHPVKKNIKSTIDDLVDTFVPLTSVHLAPLVKSATVAMLFYIYNHQNINRIRLVLDNAAIEAYKTVIHVPGRGRNILKKMRIYQTNTDADAMGIFSRKDQTVEEYSHMLNEWLFYASGSPIWLDRIKKYRGIIDYEKQRVDFEDDDTEEFYSYYSYDLDEEIPEFRPPFIGNNNV